MPSTKSHRQRKQAGVLRNDLGKELVERCDHRELHVGIAGRIDAVESSHVGAAGIVHKELLGRTAPSPDPHRLRQAR
jgi:hypothetical protein